WRRSARRAGGPPRTAAAAVLRASSGFSGCGPGFVPVHRGRRKIGSPSAGAGKGDTHLFRGNEGVGRLFRGAADAAQRGAEEGMSHHLEQVSDWRCFDGFQCTCRHRSESRRCTMQFAVYLQPAAERGPVPAAYWVSGRTCTEESCSVKAGAQRYASELVLG